MSVRAVCQMCSWFGKTGPGRAWATWHWTFADGTSQLLCGRHKTQAEGAGGFGQPVEELHGLVVTPPSIDPEVAAAARPIAFLEQVMDGLRDEIRVQVRECLRGVTLQVVFDDDGAPSLIRPTSQRKRRAS